ncbi:MAG: aldo/keto reductase [Lachnospiraceae bacterium]|nr:aldo/keto reductase [Lachnospiraceae bacterium]
MQYRKDRYGNDISAIGFGCMRFTKKGTAIDYEKSEKEILYAIEKGINYFDTAYIYPGSEVFLGSVLEKNRLRDRVKIATKLPQYLIRNTASIEKYFNTQLERLKTDHIDYYLMHMLTDLQAWTNLKNIGIIDWITEKKKTGAIGQIGFSYHGDTAMFLDILKDYDWDFCQIQYNYIDEHTQAGRKGLMAAAEKGIPVIIMEPLRGGKLATSLPKEAAAKIADSSPKRTPAELAFRWLYDQSQVTCILSGMNSIEMIDENCRVADDALPGHLTDDDRALIEEIKEIINSKTKVGCTRCAYCMPCPQGVDIPGTFQFYNNMFTESKASARRNFAQVIGIRKKPAFATQCINCGKCVKHCPQGINIPEKLKEADKALRPLPYKIAINIARKFMLDRKGSD